MEQYLVTGMSCAACAARVEKAVCAVEGVSSCTVSLLTGSMGVEGSGEADAIIRAVTQAGYGASLKGADNTMEALEDPLADRETLMLKKRLAASLVFIVPLMYISMGHTAWGWPVPSGLSENSLILHLLQLILCGIIMVINREFFMSGGRSLIHRAPNMDTLVALGAAASFLWSVYALCTGAEELYFDSAVMILTLITVGKLLEARSKGKTADALKGLIKLTPKTATVIRNGKEEIIPAKLVNTGDCFVVRPGDSIPVDGVVIRGSTAVNEALLTGESIPVDKAEGDSVSAATINRTGFIECRATRVGDDTALSQIIRMVSDAAATKAPIARIADRVAGIFVPVVMAIAVVTTIVWLIMGQPADFALERGISVLVISCPCSLGLATPVAIMVGSGMGARNGILFKTAAALEETGKARIAVLDKTGTITRGEPHFTDMTAAEGFAEEELLRLAYSLERLSEHPLAKAIVARAEEEGLAPYEAEGFEALPGNGLSAVINGRQVIGGSVKFISSEIPLTDEIKSIAEDYASCGKTPLLFAKDGRLVGIVAVADIIKDDSAEAISQLKDLGLQVIMLTGDNERTANAIGAQAGVDRVAAGLLPGEKEEAVRELKKQGKVIMVGDGINDAPALVCADIGIAVGAGADVALDAADVVVMKSSLLDVAAAIRLSRMTLTNIRENLFWAFCYNCAGIPIAAGVFTGLLGWTLNPMLCAAAMSLSSFCVVSNALRLNLKKFIKPVKEDSKMYKTTIQVTGMMCPMCEKHTSEAIERAFEVVSVESSHEASRTVIVSKAPLDEARLAEVVAEAGYQPGTVTVESE